jgi:hypothetical protein
MAYKKHMKSTPTMVQTREDERVAPFQVSNLSLLYFFSSQILYLSSYQELEACAFNILEGGSKSSLFLLLAWCESPSQDRMPKVTSWHFPIPLPGQAIIILFLSMACSLQPKNKEYYHTKKSLGGAETFRFRIEMFQLPPLTPGVLLAMQILAC